MRGERRERRSSEERLAELFARSGYVRLPDPGRRVELGARYHKGHEVRILLDSRKEVDEVRRLLEEVGFKPGTPFGKGRRLVQPIYGAKAVEWFGGKGAAVRRPQASPTTRRRRHRIRGQDLERALAGLARWRERRLPRGSEGEDDSRRRAILRARKKGATLSEIGRAAGLSRQRIHQIVRASVGPG